MAKGYIVIAVVALLATMSGCATQKRAETVADMGSITIDETVLFDFNKYALREDARPVLNEVAAKIQEHPGVFIVLEGHTDSRGSDAYNEILGEKRARAVGAYLSQEGVKFNRITFISKGERELRDSGKTEAAHRMNRRVEIRNH